METEIGTSYNGGVTDPVADRSVSVLHGEEAGAAGSVDRVAWPGHAQPIWDTIRQHSTTAARDAKTVHL